MEKLTVLPSSSTGKWIAVVSRTSGGTPRADSSGRVRLPSASWCVLSTMASAMWGKFIASSSASSSTLAEPSSTANLLENIQTDLEWKSPSKSRKSPQVDKPPFPTTISEV